MFVAYIPVGFKESDPEVKKRKLAEFFSKNVPTHLAQFEELLSGRSFLVGASLTVADLYFMAVSDLLKQTSEVPEEVSLARYRNVAGFLKRMRSLPAVVAHNKKCNGK